MSEAGADIGTTRIVRQTNIDTYGIFLRVVEILYNIYLVHIYNEPAHSESALQLCSCPRGVGRGHTLSTSERV
jgi:hypothetical protein